MAEKQTPRCKYLVLDAGPLLSLSPLQGLAEKYLTVPQVLVELKDNRAREHFEKLGLMSGVKVEVRSPAPTSISHVIQWSKKTGDYSVLSHVDICVLALTHTLHEETIKLKEQTQTSKIFETKEDSLVQVLEKLSVDETAPEWADPSLDELAGTLGSRKLNDSDSQEILETLDPRPAQDEQDLEPLNAGLALVQDHEHVNAISEGNILQADASEPPNHSTSCLYDDPSDEDDNEGEWITPDNIAFHKSRALNLLPNETNGKGQKRAVDEDVAVGCMTADFAMQNVLLQMGLSLVGLEGKRIERVKTWVLRCHACFKICNDNSKKFCPSCGNNTLLRTSVTLSSPTASSSAPIMQIHLKPNFQHRLRGTKYSIPAPKAGSAKTGSGTGLILREDQIEYMRAKRVAEGKRGREEARVTKGILSTGGVNAGVSSWMDPDWVPEIIGASAGGKGRTMRNSNMDGDLPQIGFGRKNPNERKKRK